jgi:CPA2 family monovalent cation:H+ antiporter-2
MHEYDLILTLTAGLAGALFLGYLTQRLGLSPIVGDLLAGTLLGPNTPGLAVDSGMAEQLAEIGVILLMFGVGLQFHIEELLAVRRVAVPGGIGQIVIATVLGATLASTLGWATNGAIVFGIALSVASTVVLLRALESRGVLETVNGHIAVGWLVVEDLVTVLVLVLLPPFSLWLGGSGGDQVGGQDLVTILAMTFGKVALFVGFMVIGGRRIIPWITWQIARVGPRELFTLCVIAVAMGIAFGAAELFGVSFALGAFFAGMVMRESPLSHRAAEESLPFRDSFSVLFFVSVGMLFDPQVLVHEPLHIVAVVAIIVIGKSLAAFVLVLLFGYPLNTALTVSAGLAQIGEFSFILAGLGLSLGILPEEARSLILAGAIISIAVNPLVFHLWISE